MTVVHDVEEHSPFAIPEARFERQASLFGPAHQLGVTLTRDLQGVNPERLDLDGLTDARRDDPVENLCVHPSELHTGLTASEQAVIVASNSVPRATRITEDNLGDGRLQTLAVFLREQGDRGLVRQQFIGGEDEPERGVDRVVLGGSVGIVRKSIWQHAFGHHTGPLAQDRARRAEIAGGEAETSKRDECIAAPVTEPRVARDERATGAALHQVLSCRTL